MKIRNGFVSNSSSSSFVLVVKKDDYDKVYSDLSDDAKKVADACMEFKTIFGIDVAIFSDWCDNGGGGSFDYIEVDIEGDKYGAYDELQNKLGTIEDCFSHSQDW